MGHENLFLLSNHKSIPTNHLSTHSHIIPSLSNHYPTRYFYEMNFPWTPHVSKLCSICLSVPSLFHITLCPSGSSLLWQVAGFQSCQTWLAFLCVYDHIFFLQSSDDKHVGWFCVSALAHSAAINTGVQASPWHTDFISLEHTPSSGIAGLYSSFIFNFWETFILLPIIVVLIYIFTNQV